jgi:uncharacterized membrane protein YfcA
LIGLGGAEFRLPVLVGYFKLPLRRAIFINLAVSLATVTAASATRLIVGTRPEAGTPVLLAIAMLVGGMVGAYRGTAWLATTSEHALHRAVQVLLLCIGVLLIAEALLPWKAVGLGAPLVIQIGLACLAAVGIGVVSSLLGVAGGELIIPTLIAFGIGIKLAGTLSLLISLPTILVGLWRQAAHQPSSGGQEITQLALPMSAGSVCGAVVGAMLVSYVDGAAIKLLLGCVLIVSSVRIGTGRSRHAQTG